ncbi:MAG: hypothetical protein HJJLKODD_02738 [Phycisphaerae bacterium]|nr:hypothetical protein [Phycisphaerae bacterium]
MVLNSGWCGCSGTTAVELSAARSLRAITRELRISLDEYQRDLEQLDDFRAVQAIQSMADPSWNGVGEVTVQQQQLTLLQQALQRITNDRATSLQRYYRTLNNLALLDEIADGLQQYGSNRQQLNSTIQHFFNSEQPTITANKE